MPTRYWRNLPEAARISALTQTAHQRSAQMVAAKTTVPQRRIAGAPAAKPAQQTSHHSCDGHGDFDNNNERGGTGEEILVLQGVFSDEWGRYPQGSGPIRQKKPLAAPESLRRPDGCGVETGCGAPSAPARCQCRHANAAAVRSGRAPGPAATLPRGCPGRSAAVSPAVNCHSFTNNTQPSRENGAWALPGGLRR